MSWNVTSVPDGDDGDVSKDEARWDITSGWFSVGCIFLLVPRYYCLGWRVTGRVPRGTKVFLFGAVDVVEDDTGISF
jgi:hypothetical protein